MAAPQAIESSEDEFHSLSAQGADDDDDEDDDESVAMSPPKHPVAAFQGAFEESIVEATETAQESSAEGESDATMRRRRLLEGGERHEGVGTRWKHNPRAKYHPFVKLMAQIVFGMHLLQEGQAKSNEEVVRILKRHVNEVDSFLERTSDDFDLAIKDIEERVRYLKLPMQHMDVFEVMLDEKKFRTELLIGNEKIEKIVEKTAKAMDAAAVDVENGVRSVQELSQYLTRIEGLWPTAGGDCDTTVQVFAAMRANEQGWHKYLRDLKTKGKNLRHALTTLEGVISEISKHAAAASRRNKPQSRTVSPALARPSATSSPLRSKFAKGGTASRKPAGGPGPWLDKPLPREPNAVAGAAKVADSKPHPVPFETRYEQPRQRIPTPGSRTSVNFGPLPPRTAVGPREAHGQPRESLKELADFVRISGGLRSHPPDSGRKLNSSHSQGGARIITSATQKKQFRRSKSHGAISAVPEWEWKATSTKPVGAVPANNETRARSPSQTNSQGSGLSRRLSRRLKLLPPSTNNTPQNLAGSRPIDSAHASEKQRQSEEAASDHEKDLTPDYEKADSHQERKDQPPRPGSRQNHSLFPRDAGRPLTPSQAISRDNSPSPPRHDKGWLSSDHSPPSISIKPTTHGSKGSRTLCLRRFFSHRRGESDNYMVS